MSQISEAAKEQWRLLCQGAGSADIAGPHLIQQMSDAAKEAKKHSQLFSTIAPFILPEPADELKSVLNELGWPLHTDAAEGLREALAKRGLKIVEDRP